MNPGKLLQHYDRIADAPGAIGQLRAFVLDLAVRGKLTAQDRRDEPIKLALAAAMARRAALVRAKSVRTKKLDALAKLTVSGDLPPGWSIARLGDLVDPENTISYGVLVPGNDVPDGVPFVRAQDLTLKQHPDRPNKTIAPEVEAPYARTRLRGGEILVCVVGSIGKLGTVPVSWAGANIARAVARIVPIPEISRDYLLLVLQGQPVQDFFRETTRTLAQPTLNVGLIEQTPIPLPPIAEQHRIVAKVDELMALCDRLEDAQADREAARDRLAAASLARLNAPNPETFADDARFSLEALPALTSRPDQMRSLRDTVCRMALQGRFSDDDRWPTAPSHLHDFVRLQSGYAFKSEWFGPRGVRLLRNANVAHGRVNWADEVFLPHERCKGYERFVLNAGDLVLSLNRPFIATGTKVAQVHQSDLPALLVQRVARLEIAEGLSAEYLLLWLQCSLFQEQVQPVSTNVAPHIAPTDIGRAQIFVPDIDEQRRVVDKAKELIALCDQLEDSLQSTAVHRSRLLEVLLRNAVESGHRADAPALVDEVTAA